MLKKITIYIILATFASSFVACNKDDEEETVDTTIPSSVIVSSFSLAENDNVLKNLDSVFFSIDLENAEIYNADSLPYGTNVSSLAVNITTYGSSVAEIYVPRPGNSDTVVNYLTNSTEKINFANGPVRLHLVSSDGLAQRDYSISVNVHQIKPDSLYWNSLSKNKLPSTLSNPKVQKTIKYQDEAVSIVGSHPNYTIATINNPSDFEWDIQEVSFSFTPDVNTLASTNEALYMLDIDGNLYSSVDGLTWNSCDTKWYHIYGGYEENLLGVKKVDDKYYHVTYPETTSVLIQSECPVSGTSPIVYYTNEWSNKPQAFIIGGRSSNGNTVGEMWGYDGESWAQVSQAGIYPREEMTFFAYYTFKTNTNNWSVTQLPTLIAFGGFDAEGYPGRNVFVSIDMGLHWKLADDLMQLPDYIPNMGGAQALVFEKTMTARGASDWESYPSKNLPIWWEIYNPINSRANQATNQWQCPYIYLYGGYDKIDGNLYNTVWRGVINRLSFKPLI